jgi:dihydrofolate reductase
MRQDVSLIASVGKHGQIGLRGSLPWQVDKATADGFTEITAGGVVVMGWATAAKMNGRALVSHYRALALVSHSGLTLIEEGTGPDNKPGADLLNYPDRVLYAIAATWPGRPIWIAGGERVFEAFSPLCDQFVVRVVDYDGPADCYLPELSWATHAS